MLTLKSVFASAVVVLPVIHLIGTAQAVEQAYVAREAGAPGVFLINHQVSVEGLGEAALAVHQQVGGWVGANVLGLDALSVFDKFVPAHPVDGVWTDNAGIQATGDQSYADAVDDARSHFDGLYFGGVAFKYQAVVNDLASAAAAASAHMDVICTSGPGTAQAASPDKIAALAVGASRPIAVASGVDVHNIAALVASGARAFLVASSISTDWEQLDPHRTRQLVERAKELSANF